MPELKIMQEQIGHVYASTLGIYTQISAAAMNTMMDRALEQVFTVEGAVR